MEKLIPPLKSSLLSARKDNLFRAEDILPRLKDILPGQKDIPRRPKDVLSAQKDVPRSQKDVLFGAGNILFRKMECPKPPETPLRSQNPGF